MKNKYFNNSILMSVMRMRKKAYSILITIILFLTPWIAVTSAGISIPPHADAGGPYTGKVGVPIQFDASDSYSSNGTIASYKWYCGDGTVEIGMKPTHTYSYPGVYSLTLTVKDEENNCGTETTQVTVSDDKAPTASFIKPAYNTIYFRNYSIGQTNTSSILIGPTKIHIEADDDIRIKEVQFYIDETLKHTDKQAPYEWNWNTGHFTHTIKVVVIDSSNQQSSIQQTVFKWRFHPLLLLSAASLFFNEKDQNQNLLNPDRDNDQAILLNLLKVILQQDTEESKGLFSLLNQLLSTDQQSGTLASFLHNHPLIKTSIQQKYPLIYRLIMLSDKSDSSNEHTTIFNNNILLRTIFLALLSSKLSSDNTLLQSNDDQIIEGGTFAKWLRDHPLITISSALVLLNLIQRIRNRQIGKSDGPDDAIQNKKPVARSGGPYSGIIGKTVTFTAKDSYDDDGTIVKFNWDFGDGNYGTGETITHTYNRIGKYTVLLTVTDDNGATANDTTTITISEDVKKATSTQNDDTVLFWIISGGLSALLIAGLAVLQFRRRLFE